MKRRQNEKDEENDDRKINLRRHQNYHFISPKFIIRFVLIIGAAFFLLYQLFDTLEQKQNLPKTEEKPASDSDSLEVEVEFE